LSFWQTSMQRNRGNASRDLEREPAVGINLDAELRRSYEALERLSAEHVQRLDRAKSDLQNETKRRKNAEARFTAISESVAYGAWVYRADGTAELVSASYLMMLGETLEKLQECAWYSFIYPSDQERVGTLWKEVTAAKAPWNCEFRVKGSDGEVRHILSRGAPLSGGGTGEPIYAGIQLDVTDRVILRDELIQAKSQLEAQVECKTLELTKANRQLLMDLADRLKTESALRDRESQLRAIYENALDSMIVLDDGRRVMEANEAAQQLFGTGLEKLREMRWDDLIPVERLAGIEERWRAFLVGGMKRGDVDVRRADGQQRLVTFSSRANILPGRHLVMLRDITEQREAEDSLRMLSHRLMHLQDEERRRIARELHDSTGQSLAAMQMYLDTIRATAGAMTPKARRALEEATNTCKSCTTDIRTISYLLHPPLLDELGLLPALEWYVAGFRERSGIRISEEIEQPERPLSRDLNTALFRIIQEALTNIRKHAESSKATIRLRVEKSVLILEIKDNGKGFEAERIGRSRQGVNGLGVGITGMRERVRQLGGTLEIMKENPGTLVRAKFPTMEVENGNTQGVGSGRS
jgi:PAS domain S-box-containing protein